MGIQTGFGITYLMAADEPHERQLTCLKEFADLNLTPLFFEMVSQQLYKIEHRDGVTHIEEYNGSDKEELIENWEFWCGDVGSDIKEDLQLVDIFIPDFASTQNDLGPTSIAISLFQPSDQLVADIKFGQDILQVFFDDEEFMQDDSEESEDMRNDFLFLEEKLEVAAFCKFLFRISN